MHVTYIDMYKKTHTHTYIGIHTYTYMIYFILEKSQQKVLVLYSFFPSHPTKGSQFNCERSRLPRLVSMDLAALAAWSSRLSGPVDGLERGPGIINDDLLTMRMVSFIKGYIKNWSDPG